MAEDAPASLTSLLENASSTELEVSVMALSDDARERLRTTLERVDLQTRTETEMMGTLPPRSVELTYRVAFVDGSEIDVSLQEDASVQDAILAIAEKKGANAGRLKLLVSGQTDLLPCAADVSLVEAANKQTDLMVVYSAYLQLGKIVGPLISTEENFEHFAASAFEENGFEEMELCEGFRIGLREEVKCTAQYKGGIFKEGLPLSGKVLIRILVEHRSYALGMGVGTADMDFQVDAEYNSGFIGLYHGGATINVCMQGQRTFMGGGKPTDWGSGKRLAIILDIDECTMQCFDGLSRFGAKESGIPREPLWPAVVLIGDGDCVRMSVSHL